MLGDFQFYSHYHLRVVLSKFSAHLLSLLVNLDVFRYFKTCLKVPKYFLILILGFQLA